MATIACFSVTTERERQFFTETFGDDIILFEDDVQHIEDIPGIEHIQVVTSFTGSVFSPDQIERFPKLELIATRSTGYDHIDLEYAQAKGIAVANVPVYGANTVAEHAFALLLAISRKAHASYKDVQREMNFSMRGAPEYQGFDLRGKTIGVIGVGNIGKHAIAIAHGFGMNIWAFDLHPSDELAEKYGVKWGGNVEHVIKESDIVTIHVPYNTHTHHLFNTKSLHFIKDTGMVLINTSRGEVVDTKALIVGLEQGKILAAGIDVLEMEAALTGKPIEGDDPVSVQMREMQELNQKLVQDPRVIVTPHNAFNTVEAIDRIWETTRDNIKTYREGLPTNLVTKN